MSLNDGDHSSDEEEELLKKSPMPMSQEEEISKYMAKCAFLPGGTAPRHPSLAPVC